jgi:HK97 family phage portal protein
VKIRDIVLGTTPAQPQLKAALEPFVFPPGSRLGYQSFVIPTVFRADALGVPAVARARNLIASTIAGMPLLYYAVDGTEIDRLPWMIQPELDTPRITTMAYTVDSLFFYGRAYWQVIEEYQEDGRPRRFQWIDPTRVGFRWNREGTKIVDYDIEGILTPRTGLGRLIVFTGVDEGLLARAGRTIKTALELERASLNYAETPAPSMVLKNTGVDLPKDQVESLLTRWKEARTNRATAYLNASLDAQVIGFSPKDMALVEAREYIVQDLARATGIPAWYLGADTGSSMTYSNINSTRRDLIDFSLQPYVHAVEQRLSMQDVLPRGQHVAFSFTDFLRSSPIERAQLYNSLIPLGILTPEEARQLEDFAPGGPLQ